MPLPANHGNNLRRQFLTKTLSTTTYRDGSGLTKDQKENVKKWITRYRRNWDLFVEEVFGIKLYPIQKITIHMMGISHEFWDIATRGSAKSFLVGIGAMCEFCLKPYSEIVITSSTIAQASKLVETKIRDEIIKKLSPYLLYMYEREYIVITKSSNEGAYKIENKLNGSTIVVLPCLESSRGPRATFLIFEEARLLKKSLVDQVFIPMGHDRQAIFKTENREYNTKRWQEPARAVYITSARYGWEWFWRAYQNCVRQYYLSKHEVYIPFAEDIFAAIQDGSRTWADYRRAKKNMSEMDFRMEILNEMFNQSEDAFFDLQTMTSLQIIEDAWRPPSNLDLISNKDIGNKPKGENEVRMVIVDFAFANTTSNQKNDNTIIMCMSLHWKKNHFERHVDYITGWAAGDSDGAMNRVRELYWDYDADYVVDDLRSGGETLYNLLTAPMKHPQRGSNWDPRGLTVSNEMYLHVAQENKVADLRQRTVDKNAVPCVIPIIAFPEFNTLMWIELKKSLERGNIKFLLSASAREEMLEDNGTIFNMTSEEYGRELAPYGQTDLLINEAVNLRAEYKETTIKLVEPKSGTKDRIVVLAYGNYIATKLENHWNQMFLGDDENDSLEQFDFVF